MHTLINRYTHIKYSHSDTHTLVSKRTVFTLSLFHFRSLEKFFQSASMKLLYTILYEHRSLCLIFFNFSVSTVLCFHFLFRPKKKMKKMFIFSTPQLSSGIILILKGSSLSRLDICMH